MNIFGFQIELKNVTSKIQGTWKCMVESYVKGHGKGNVAKSQMDIVVLPKLKVSEGTNFLTLDQFFNQSRFEPSLQSVDIIILVLWDQEDQIFLTLL